MHSPINVIRVVVQLDGETRMDHDIKSTIRY
jgi:hypothetical protein